MKKKNPQITERSEVFPGVILQHTLQVNRPNLVVWSPDGRYLATTDHTHLIQIWETETGQEVQQLKTSDKITSLAWSPENARIVTGSNKGVLRLWNIADGDSTLLKGSYRTSVDLLMWSPTDDLFASLSDGDLKIWEVSDFKANEINRLNGQITISASWSRTGRYLACLHGLDVTLWDKAENNFKLLQITQNGKASTAWITHQSAVGSYVKQTRVWSKSQDDLELYLFQVEDARNKQPNPIDHYQENLAIFRNLYKLQGSKTQLQGTYFTASNVKCAWHSDDQLLLTSFAHGLLAWNVEKRSFAKGTADHIAPILDIEWSTKSNVLLTASEDGTVRLYDSRSSQRQFVLEGHPGKVHRSFFAADDQILVSVSIDGIHLWNGSTHEPITVLDEADHRSFKTGAIYPHPSGSSFISFAQPTDAIYLWTLNPDLLIQNAGNIASVRYTNAKVMLMGDTGVGKSGLALVLTGKPFKATDSTHGRHVWMMNSERVKLSNTLKEIRETILWDLAGQPGYRLIHQLHLNEVNVALVVFDARSETDPFTGVRHWARALKQVTQIHGYNLPIKKFLIAARADRGGIGVSRERIDTIVRELEFDGYIETSAREDLNIQQLEQLIRDAVNWDSVPRVSSTEFFQNIKSFLLDQKSHGMLLVTEDNLYHTFLTATSTQDDSNVRGQFDTGIGRIESQGLIRRLSFGDLILLQPELLDAYASALVNAAKDEPDGLGFIVEEDAQYGRFRMSQDERIADKEQERLLLIATIEDLLRYEIALREYTDSGQYLVFPSQLTRENPDLPDPEGKAVIFTFDGPVLNIYSTLAVRLSNSGLFRKKEMWKNAATYSARVGGTCGIFLREFEEGRGRIVLFFDKQASEETRFVFEDFVQAHLQRRCIADSLSRQRIFICGECGTAITEEQAQKRRDRGFTSLICSVCTREVSLLDREERLSQTEASIVPQMDLHADISREQATAVSILEGKRVTNSFDVFLCHNSKDKPEVKKIGEDLKALGILPWLDEWELRPGLAWQRLLEKQIGNIKSAAVFVGKDGVGPWQHQELDAFLREFVRRQCPVIPVILSSAPKKPKLPIFLQGLTWVDFRNTDPDPLKRLIWGITGEK